MKRGASGFTLLELALVLLVITVLLGGLAVPFTRQIETRRIAETQKAMATIQDALIGYAMTHKCQCVYDNNGTLLNQVPPTPPYCDPASCLQSNLNLANMTITHPYLPCPDYQGNPQGPGQEGRPPGGGACTIPSNGNNNGHVGWLPWAALGLPEADAWGDRYAYDVYLPYADQFTGIDTTSPPQISSPQPGQIFVCNTSHGCPGVPSYVASQVPAVVISYGPGGLGGFSANNNQWAAMPDQTTAPDEYLNATYGGSGNTRGYVSHPPTAAGSLGGQFDDLVTWLSWSALVNRVCPAGGCAPPP